MSRAAAVYELSACELLAAYDGTEQHDVVNLDLDVSPATMDLIQTLAGCERSEVSACSLNIAYSHWLPDWVCSASTILSGRVASLRNVTEEFHPFPPGDSDENLSIAGLFCGILKPVGEAEAGSGGDQPAKE